MPENHPPTNGAFVGFQDRLSLDTPPLREPTGLTSHAKMGVVRGNNHLKNIYEHTLSPLPKLIATVRWSILQMPSVAYAHAIGLSANGYKPMEREREIDQIPHRIKYTRLLHDWEKRGVPAPIREQLLELIDSGNTLNSFYNRVGYELGHAAVEEKIPSLYNTLWQRERTGTVPKFLEVLHHMNALYPQTSEENKGHHALRLSQACDIWRTERLAQYQSRDIEHVLAQVMTETEMEMALQCGLTLTHTNLLTFASLTSKNADRLLRMNFVEWEKIEPLMVQICSADAYSGVRDEWNNCMENDRLRPSFRDVFISTMRTKGLNYAAVARTIGVRPPEDRGKGVRPSKRTLRYRVDREVRDTVLDETFSGQVAIDAPIAAVTDDLAARQQLTLLFENDRRRFYRRTGSGLHGKGLEMRIRRERAGVSLQQVALQLLPEGASQKQIRALDLALQHLERMDADTYCRFEDVLPILQRFSEAKVAQVEMRKKHLKPTKTIKHRSPEMTKRAPAVSPSQFDVEKIRSILINVIEPTAITDALVNNLASLPHDHKRRLAYLGDAINASGTASRLEVIIYRASEGVFLSLSSHPFDKKEWGKEIAGSS